MMAPADRNRIFLLRILPVAKDEELHSGIKPIITATQSAHESGWGTSLLTIESNNLFGVMAGKAWMDEKKPVVWKQTVEYSDIAPSKIRYWEYPNDILEKTAMPNGRTKLNVRRAFRSYSSWSDSVRDWAQMVTTNPRFAKAATAAKLGDVSLFAEEMRIARYATDPNYKDLLVRVGESVAGGLEPGALHGGLA